jgi:hypothetical protein
MGANTQNKSGNGKVVVGVGIIRVSVSGPSVIIIVITNILGSCSNACP